MKTYKKGDLRIWWIPQLGCGIPTFYWDVKDIYEAKTLLDCLAQYDLYQYRNKIKPDYSNAGGLTIYDDDPDNGRLDWFDWMSEAGDDLEEHFEYLNEEVK